MSNDTPAVVTVPTKSSFLSKINWTNALGLLAGLLTFFGVVVPPELQTEVMVLISSATAILSIIQRTWFTKSITTTSAK
jgi:hypothetical protein